MKPSKRQKAKPKRSPPKSKKPKRRTKTAFQESFYDPKYCEEIIKHATKAEGTFISFAAKINVCEETLYLWRNKHPEFKAAMKIALSKNHAAMNELGLRGMRGKLPQGAWQTAWIFAMKARHGWRDQPAFEDDAEYITEYEDGTTDRERHEKDEE